MSHKWVRYNGDDMKDVEENHDLYECVGCGIRAAYLKKDNFTIEQVADRLKNLKCGVGNEGKD